MNFSARTTKPCLCFMIIMNIWICVFVIGCCGPTEYKKSTLWFQTTCVCYKHASAVTIYQARNMYKRQGCVRFCFLVDTCTFAHLLISRSNAKALLWRWHKITAAWYNTMKGKSSAYCNNSLLFFFKFVETNLRSSQIINKSVFF